MRYAATSLAFVAGVLVALFWGLMQPVPEPAFAQGRPPAIPHGADLMAFTTQLGEKVQQLTVIDPRQQALLVYHVDGPSGTITLKSVRNIQWDSQLLEFNGTNPRPQEIRSMLSNR